MIKYRFILLFKLIALLSYCNSDKDTSRKLITLLNPNCPDHICTPGNYLVYTRSLSTENALHYVISGGPIFGPLSVLLITSNNTDSMLSFDWNKFEANNKTGFITLTKEGIHSSYAMIFSQIIQFRDTENDPRLEISTQHEAWDTVNLNWEDIEKATGLGGVEANNRATFQAKRVISDFEPEDFEDSTESNHNASKLFQPNGILSITLSHSASQGHASMPPKLIYSGTNVLLESTLNRLASPWNETRYAFEFILVTSHKSESEDSMKVSSAHHVDDEFTPGIFYIHSLLGQSEKVSKDSSCYIQWKPVAYSTSALITRISSTVQYSEPEPVTSTSSLNNSIVYSWFGDDMYSNYHSTNISLSFGTPKDGFYKETKYMKWSNTFGYGKMPEETVSFAVILIIACGLGLPFVLIVLGGIYIIVKQKATLSNYERIDSD